MADNNSTKTSAPQIISLAEAQKEFMPTIARLETGKDNSRTVGTHNVYNIKDFSGQGGTRAFDKVEKSNDAYRNYDSREAADNDFYRLMQNKRYRDAGVLEPGISTEERFARMRKAGYATDPEYVNKATRTLQSVRAESGQQVQQEPQKQTIDFSRYMDKYGRQISAAREMGYDDVAIMKSIANEEQTAASQSRVRSVMDSTRKDVTAGATRIALRDGDHRTVVSYLATQPAWKDMVDFYQANGADAETIVNALVPEAKKGIDAYQRRNGKSGLQNVVDGVKDAGESMSLAARQITTFDKDKLAQLQAEEQARRNNVDRQALLNTTGGAVGSVGGEMAAEIAAAAGADALIGSVAGPVGSAVGGAVGTATGIYRVGRRLLRAGEILGNGAVQGAAAGAVHGALTPTIAGENRMDNVGNDALSGAVGGAVGNAAIASVGAVGGRAANKVRQILNAPSSSVADDVNARIISNRLAHDLDTPLTGPHISPEWVDAAKNNLSGKYDSLLDGNHALVSPELRAQLTHPDFQAQLSPDMRNNINNLLFRTEQKAVPKSMPVLDENGQPTYTFHRRGLTDEHGNQVMEPYQETVFDSVPRYETKYRPRTEFEPQDPKLVNKQVVGNDGNVQTVVRQRPKYDDKTGERIIDQSTIGDTTVFTPAMEQYNKPLTQQVPVPGKMSRTQVRDKNNNVVMEPYRSPVLDGDGAPIVDKVPRIVEKQRQATTPFQKPVFETRNVLEDVLVPRTEPIPLREVHNLLRDVKYRQYQNTNGQYTDGSTYDALAKLREHVDDLMHNHSVMSPEWAAKNGVNPEAIPNYLRDQMTGLNDKYGQLSVASEVLRRAKMDGANISDPKLWDSVISSKQYADRAFRGNAPLQNIQQATQQNAKVIGDYNQKVEQANKLTDNMLVNGAMLTNPLGIGSALSGTLKAAGYLRKNQLAKNLNRSAGVEDLIVPGMNVDLTTLKKMAQQGSANSVERRVNDTGGTRRYTDDKTSKLRKAAAGPIAGISTYDDKKDK